jgi:hypothetical protein
MTPTDTTIDNKVHSFLYLNSNFGYNSLGFTCTCRYLNIGTNVSQSTSPSKLNFRFIGSPIVLHWKGHNSTIRSAIEVNEHLMEIFQIDLVPPQYHIGKASKLSRHSAAISVGCYGVVAGLLFTLGTQAQVGARPKNMENT